MEVLDRIDNYLDEEIKVDWDAYYRLYGYLYKADEALWSGAVATKWTPPAGLFTQGASKIADTLASASSSLKQAMSRLNFYENRAGKNLSAKARKNLEKAKVLLRKKFAKE